LVVLMAPLLAEEKNRPQAGFPLADERLFGQATWLN
jgi:hypothetical protein